SAYSSTGPSPKASCRSVSHPTSSIYIIRIKTEKTSILSLCRSVPHLSLFRRQSHVPGETEQGEGADDPVAHVNLPPAQAVAGRAWEGVMGVVPSLPQSEDAEHEVVPALVAVLIGSEAPQEVSKEWWVKSRW